MKLTKKMREALKLSIEKWRQIVRGEMPDTGADNCALCMAARDKDGSLNCHKCPVGRTVKDDWCMGTPYTRWINAQGVEWSTVADTPERVTRAKHELRFLRNILKDST